MSEKVNIYRTISGDTWDLISYKVYGDEIHFHELMRANIELIDIGIFDSNIPIIIPNLKILNYENKNNLPPWRR